MRLLARLSWVFALLVFSIAGCNEVTAPTTAPVTFTVLTYYLQSGFDQPRVEGVEICQTDTPKCMLTDERGEATLQLPFDQEISCTLEKEGYAPGLYMNVIPATGLDSLFGLAPDQSATEFFEDLMSPYPMRDTGTILIFVNPPRAGVTFDLVDATGPAFYMDEEWNARLDLAATTTPAGWGGFIEVGPGRVRHINFGGLGEDCAVGWGWPDDDKNSFRMPVREGYTSIASVLCPPPL